MITNNLTTGIVFQEEGQAMTNSLIVAREFGKRHDHVLRDIDNLVGGLPKSGDTRMFQKVMYTNEQNGQQYPMYKINRDGFTLLAMGFTGERALEFKLKFLQAFNAMGQMLSSDEYILMRSQQIMKRLNDQLNQRVKILEGQKRMLEQENDTLAPKAAYTDEVLQSSSTYTHTQMAKELNFRSVNAFVAECAKQKIMYRQSGMWMLYSKYAGKGYMKMRTTPYRCSDGTTKTNTITVWTEEGRRFLHEHYNVAIQPIEVEIPFEQNL